MLLPEEMTKRYPGVDIVCDTREDEQLYKWFREQAGITVLREALPAGDYWVGERVLIERTTPTDLVGKVRNRRLWEQLAMMRYINPEGENVLLLEGSLYRVQQITKWARYSVAGLLKSIYLKDGGFGVSMISMPGVVWTQDHILSLAKGFKEDKKTRFALRTVRRGISPAKQAEFLVSGLPGIGGEKAIRILQHFGSARRFFSHPERVVEIEGIKGKTADKIMRVLEYEF